MSLTSVVLTEWLESSLVQEVLGGLEKCWCLSQYCCVWVSSDVRLLSLLLVILLVHCDLTWCCSSDRYNSRLIKDVARHVDVMADLLNKTSFLISPTKASWPFSVCCGGTYVKTNEYYSTSLKQCVLVCVRVSGLLFGWYMFDYWAWADGLRWMWRDFRQCAFCSCLSH